MLHKRGLRTCWAASCAMLWCLAGATNAAASGGTGVELIRNGDFAAGAAFWKKADFYHSYHDGRRAAETRFDIADESARLRTAHRGSAAWHAHLLQNGLVLERGRRYRLSFRALVRDADRADPEVTIVASVIRCLDSIEVYFEDAARVTGANRWQTFVFEFNAPSDDSFARLDLNYGRSPGANHEPERLELRIDDVSLRKLDDSRDPRVVTNGIGDNKPVDRYGALRLDDRGQLASTKTGQPVQLRGVSLHGVQWDEPWYYANREALLEVKENWRADLIRVPVYLGQGGYIENPSLALVVQEIVDTAIALKMYVIIDWHVHNDAGDPMIHLARAKEFFEQMARRYGDQDAVIFEIANEPNGVDWPQIKRYADEIVSVIRARSDNLIIVGTPLWSQEVHTPVADPVAAANVAYGFHFYATTHRLSQFKDKIEQARRHGLGVFVSEWGPTDYSGDGHVDLPETTRWLDFLDRTGISWVTWNLSAQHESSAMLRPRTHPVPAQVGGWKQSDLTDAGRYVRDRLRQASGFAPDSSAGEPPPPSTGPVQTELRTASDWGAGYCVDVLVRNQHAAPVVWQVSLPVEGRVSNAWNVAWQQEGMQMIASGHGERAELQPGQEFPWGFCAVRN
jgi:hypothetical protein